MSEILGIIPARGGSKGVPRKNIADVAGKPLIGWTLEAAQACPELSHLHVSTDDDEIATTCAAYNARPAFLRPAHLATDNSDPVDAALDAADRLEAQSKRSFTHICLLQPTSPFRTAEDISGTIAAMFDNNAQASCSVCISHHNPFLMRTWAENGLMKPFMQNMPKNPRRQALPEALFINGAVYCVGIQTLRELHTFYPARLAGYTMPEKRSLQIDTPFDLELARLIATHLH
jgi:CMP-N-acetylneuraminic acid synthetase